MLFHTSKSRSFQAQSGGLIQSEHQVHVLHGLTACTFQQVVYSGVYHQLIAGFFYVDQAFIGVHDLFQIDRIGTDTGEGMLFVIMPLQGIGFSERAFIRRTGAYKNAAGKIAPPGNEVYRCDLPSAPGQRKGSFDFV